MLHKLAFVILGAIGIVAATVAAQSPNILLIIADDQGYGDCSAYPGHATDIHTPNIDRIAAEGALFTNGYVAAPACSPSRTGLITGRYQERFDKTAGWHTTLPQAATTFAEHLHAAGYATMMIGKNDFGHPLDNPLADRRYPLNHGYDHHLGFEAHAHDYFLLTEDIERRTPDPHGESPNVGPLDFDRTRKDFPGGYTTDIFTQAAIAFMTEQKDKPFLLTVAFNAVHDIVHQVPPKYLDKYGLKPIPLYDPETMGKYADYYNTYNKYGKVTQDDTRKYFLANIDCLDDNVGKILSALDELHLADNTLLVFISDNGGSPNAGGNNHPLRGSKYYLYEGGIRIPFMLRYPGHVAPHQIVDDPIMSIDLLPTFVEAAKGKPMADEASIDGVSLLPRLEQGAPAPAERTLYWKFQQFWAVRRGDWKIERTAGPPPTTRTSSWTIDGPRSRKPQLFNLATDLAEQHDVATDHPDIVASLTDAYKKWEATHGELHEGAEVSKAVELKSKETN